MTLPVTPPIEPMLAEGTDEIPVGDYLYEPKWDGFRTLAFKDGNDVYLQSRDSKPMLRYFPELLAPMCEQLPDRIVLDGELEHDPGPTGPVATFRVGVEVVQQLLDAL